MMIKIIRNAQVFAPEERGKKDLLIVGEKIVAIEDSINWEPPECKVLDAGSKILTPGLIDQHIHITGAGGTQGYLSMTQEVAIEELIACGTTVVLGMLGTDGVNRSLNSLHTKVKSLELEGISAYMLTSYYGIPPLTITGSVLEDLMLIDKVIGCKVAISDPRSSFPTENELLKLLWEVHVGGLSSGKGGILHVHLGALESGMAILIEAVEKHGIPVEHISPTHVGRTKPLFEQAITFAKLGGMIDISTGGTKFDEPWKQVLYALENGVPIDNMTLSSDGNAGVAKRDNNGKVISFYQAPLDLNLVNVINLIKEGGVRVEDAFRLITSNPAKNLSLKNKGKISVGADADFCLFDTDFTLTDVMARGEMMMSNKDIIMKSSVSS